MITDRIRDFMSRDWTAARVNKDAYWAERIARCGPAEALRMGDELRRQVLACSPGWPTASAREADLDCHVRLAALFRRADSARRG